jgi:hypothetical protein
MSGNNCFECGNPNTYNHHVVPKSKGGTRTIPLCGDCHAKAHYTNSQWANLRSLSSDALKQKRARGEFAGGKLRYGLKNDGGHIVADEKEVALLDMARRLRSAGLSLRGIAAEMESAGYVARNGQRISAPVISRMLSA